MPYINIGDEEVDYDEARDDARYAEAETAWEIERDLDW